MGTDALDAINSGSLPLHGFLDEVGSPRQTWLDVGDIRPGRIYTPELAEPARHGRARLGERLRLAAVWGSLRRTDPR